MRAKFLIAACACALAGFGIAAYAQNIPTPPFQSSVNTTDAIPVVTRGVPTAQQFYLAPAQITSQMGYQKVSPATGFSYTFGNSQSMIVISNAATLAQGTITMAAAPSDGDQNCVFAQNTVTTFNFVANTGQTLNNGVTAIGPLAQICYLYSLINNTWDRSK